MRSDDTVLLHAASGGVGYAAGQLAVVRGATVIGTCSPANFEKLRAIGVTPVEHGDGLESRLSEVAPDGVTAAADFVGGVLDITRGALTASGRHVSIADPEAVEHGGRWLWVRPDGEGLTELLRLVASGELDVAVDRVLPLDQVPQGFRLSQSGEAQGKIIVDVER